MKVVCMNKRLCVCHVCFRYEVEFGVADAVARFSDILKQKMKNKGVTVKAEAKSVAVDVKGGVSVTGAVGGGKGTSGGSSSETAAAAATQNLSSDDVMAAENMLDQVMHWPSGRIAHVDDVRVCVSL